MKQLSRRDIAIALAMPSIAVLFFSFWYGIKPLMAKRDALLKRIATYASDSEDDLSARIKAARRQLEAANASRNAAKERIAAEKAKMEQESRWAGDMPIPERFQRIARQLEASHLRFLSAKKSDEPMKAVEWLPSVAEALSPWTIRVRGTFLQMREFLSANTVGGWIVPVTLDMFPSAEPGGPAEWEMTVLL